MSITTAASLAQTCKGNHRRRSSDPVVELTRGYHFSSAHRLHSTRFSPEENARIYGRCNNPNGHGHTYRLQVTIRGSVSPATGSIADGERLDEVVRRQVVRRLDRRDLNRILSPADGPTSTTEALAAWLWRALSAALPPGRLWRLRVEETRNNFFELDREGANGMAPRPQGPRKRRQKASAR